MIKKNQILLIGAGGHAKSCLNTIEQIGTYKVAAIVGLPSEVGNSILSYKVSNSDNDLELLFSKCQNATIAVGQISSASARIELFKKARKMGFHFPVLVSPHASVSRHSKIGLGTIVMPGAIINAGAIIGENCIINSGAVIEHDVEVSDHCHISTGAIINGNVFVGANSFIGSRATIKEGIEIGKNSIVGMGLVVRGNIAENQKYIGVKI